MFTAKRAGRVSQGIDQGGLLKYVHGGEYHAFNPDVVQTLQKAVQTAATSTTKNTRIW